MGGIQKSILNLLKKLDKYNIDLSDAIFVVLYEVFDFNEIGDYVVEIYPLI